MFLTRWLKGQSSGESRTLSPAPKARLGMEVLEARDVPATFVVTNTSADENVTGSLPWAVRQANYFSPGLDYINFNIPGAGNKLISLTDTLYIADQVVIDATTQPGYSTNPVIHVRGNANVASLFLLTNDPWSTRTSSGSTIRGFGLGDYTANAITILSTSNWNWIQNNWLGHYIGTNGLTATRTAFAAPTYYTSGIGIQSSGNTIRYNTISGVYNGLNMGEAIEGSWSGKYYGGNFISENFIGTNPDGTAYWGNTSDGIFFGAGAIQNFIGDNVISGNSSAGVELLHSSNNGNVIYRNMIGVNKAGNASLPNGELGILLGNGANGNAIGGSFGGNVISGNGLGGVALGTAQFPQASGNWVQNNIIGLNAGRTAVLGTQATGIAISDGAANNVIQSNQIGGQTSHGITMRSTSGNFINNNWIGQNNLGNPFLNGGFGITLLAGANFNFVTQNWLGQNWLGPLFVDPQAFSNAIS